MPSKASYNLTPDERPTLPVHAQAKATLTAFSDADIAGGFEVHVTSAAAIVVTPQGGEAAITVTPAAGVLPYKLPFRCSLVDAASVATYIVVY